MLLMCDTGGCEALGVGALTPMQVLGTQREPEGQAMWWDNQVPLMTLVGGLVVVEDGLSRRRTRARPCCVGEPCGGPLLGLRGPMSSWRMLELGEAWRGDHSANRVSLALSDLSDLSAPPPALAAVRFAGGGFSPSGFAGGASVHVVGVLLQVAASGSGGRVSGRSGNCSARCAGGF